MSNLRHHLEHDVDVSMSLFLPDIIRHGTPQHIRVSPSNLPLDSDTSDGRCGRYVFTCYVCVGRILQCAASLARVPTRVTAELEPPLVQNLLRSF